MTWPWSRRRRSPPRNRVAPEAQRRCPNIICRASAVLTGGTNSSARQREPAQRGERREVDREEARERIGGADRHAPVQRAALGEGGQRERRRAVLSRARRTSAWASRRPRFSPWPATGCSVCAALPIATVRRSTSVSQRVQAERKRGAPCDPREAAHALAERDAEFGEECFVGELRAAGRFLRRAAPDERVVGADARRRIGSSAIGPSRVKRSHATCGCGADTLTVPTIAVWP